MISTGEKKMPRKLPKALLKIAPASLPPTALVRMTAEETGGGMQLSTRRLRMPGCAISARLEAGKKTARGWPGHAPLQEPFLDSFGTVKDGCQQCHGHGHHQQGEPLNDHMEPQLHRGCLEVLCP
jgi:hypothetical protein